MKRLIERIIQSRNPQFQFDKCITNRVILSLVLDKMGYFIRGLKFLFSFKTPRMLLLGRSTRFFNIANISFGRWVKIEDFTYMSALGRGQIKLGNNVGIGAFSRVIISTSFNQIGEHIHIGNNVGIGEYAYLGGAGGLDIGDDCIIGQYFSCHPENHNYQNENLLIREQMVTRQGITIGKNCWIGSKVTILDGVTIGNNCVIAAGAVVTKSMPDNSVIGGVPARQLKTIAQNNKHAA